MIWPFKRTADRDEDASVRHQRGLELLRANEPAAAIAEFERASQLNPENSEFLKNLGNAHKAAGSREKAVECYQRSLALGPDYLPSLYNLGMTLHEMNRLNEAERLFRRVHEINTRDADALFHLGTVLYKRSRFADAAQAFRMALELTPGNPYLWLSLGSACHEIPGQLDESIRCLRKCIELEPDLADAHCQIGVAYRTLGSSGQAAGSFAKALELQPDSVDARHGLGDLRQDEGRIDEAIDLYRAAIGFSPDRAVSHNNLGCALARKERFDEAVDCFRKAITLQPDFAGAHQNLGNVYSLQGARDLAVRCFERALQLRPASASITECLLFEMQHICDWSRIDELCDKRRRSVFEATDEPVSPFSLLSIPSTPSEQSRSASNYARSRFRAIGRDRPGFKFDREPGRKLRIGCLSADFHEHATAYLTAELYELHDRSHFEVFAYSYGPDDRSPIRARLKRSFDRFLDVRSLSHAEAATAIHADGVDILVDLKGYTIHARPEIMALRPAPIQVNYLGYPGTMGADFIDYLIGDRFITPVERAGHFSENLVIMPDSYQVNDRRRLIAETPSRQALGLPENGFVFCCFNQAYKILPDVFAAWMRMLKAVPGSVLWLLEWNPWAAQNLRRETSGHGVDPSRLIFAPSLPLAEHLGRLSAADLFLDTLPYNAHTTASDALWVGLPLLTCAGETFASRVAGSLLTAVGVPDLITRSLADYEALGLRLARAPGELTELWNRLSCNRETAPLFDTPRFVRHLETAYETMWRIHRSGSAPRLIEL